MLTCRDKHQRAAAFTLIEVLVVVGIISLLVAILLPSLGVARMRARIVCVHADLRNITLALDAYALNYHDKLPPTRQACGSDILYELPVELADARYLPTSPNKLKRSYFEDRFNPGLTYKYRAPGPVWQNGAIFDFPDISWKPRSKIWVPDDFPFCQSEQGCYYYNRTNEPKSPATYAVWSVGPDPQSPKFTRYEGSDSIDENRFPLQRSLWLMHSSDTGLITHFRTRTGLTYMSP